MVENTPTSIQGPNTVATPYGPYTPPGPQTPTPTPTPSQTPAPATAPVSSSAHKLQAAANAGGNLSPSAIVGGGRINAHDSAVSEGRLLHERTQ